KGESYETYLKRVKANDIARKVKIADLTHNMDLSRLAKVTEKDIVRQQKYQQAKLFLLT
ncbi:guanosine-3',5'-bis(diphosphate) 3'-pyrophosphohydrolase, partial [Glaesserella parasuis]